MIPYLVRADLTPVPEAQRSAYPFEHGEHLLMLADDIENMRGHCVVVNRANKVLWGYHSEHFVKLTLEET